MWEIQRCAYCDLSYDAIGKLETFAEDMRFIARSSKLDPGLFSEGDLGLALHSSKTATSKNDKRKKTLKYFSLLSPAQRMGLFRLYEFDFRLFGYSPRPYLMRSHWEKSEILQ